MEYFHEYDVYNGVGNSYFIHIWLTQSNRFFFFYCVLMVCLV